MCPLVVVSVVGVSWRWRRLRQNWGRVWLSDGSMTSNWSWDDDWRWVGCWIVAIGRDPASIRLVNMVCLYSTAVLGFVSPRVTCRLIKIKTKRFCRKITHAISDLPTKAVESKDLRSFRYCCQWFDVAVFLFWRERRPGEVYQSQVPLQPGDENFLDSCLKSPPVL